MYLITSSLGVQHQTHYGSGIGLFFSALMLSLSAIQARYTGLSLKNSDEFNSASRSVKPGLIASGIVSAWTWAAILVSERTLHHSLRGCPALLALRSADQAKSLLSLRAQSVLETSATSLAHGE